MGFTITSVREMPPVRYEKVGRLIPGDHDTISIIRDGTGEIGSIPTTDILLLLGGADPDGLSMSASGNRVFLTGPGGQEYVALTRQVRGMMRDWPHKKAALFVVHSFSNVNSPLEMNDRQ
jgi:hypothetical protein